MNTHEHTTADEKLSRLKRAQQIMSAGYTQEVAEKRTRTNIRHLRKWAMELNFKLKAK